MLGPDSRQQCDSSAEWLVVLPPHPPPGFKSTKRVIGCIGDVLGICVPTLWLLCADD